MYSLLERALKPESGVSELAITPHFNNIYEVTETAFCYLLGTEPTSSGASEFSMSIKIKQRGHTVDLTEKPKPRLNNLLKETVPATAAPKTQTRGLNPEANQVHCYSMALGWWLLLHWKTSNHHPTPCTVTQVTGRTLTLSPLSTSCLHTLNTFILMVTLPSK